MADERHMRHAYPVLEVAQHLAAVAAGTTQATPDDFSKYLWLHWRLGLGWETTPLDVDAALRDYQHAVRVLGIAACDLYYAHWTGKRK